MTKEEKIAELINIRDNFNYTLAPREVFDDAIKALEQEQKPEWIPVSERLPEYSGNYLITIADSNYKNGQHFEISWFYPSGCAWSFRNADAIAWMPLPEPYKAESEDK